MYFFWFFMYASMPYLIIFGMLGLFGEEAGRAAEDIATGIVVLLLIILVVVAVHFGLDYIGLL